MIDTNTYAVTQIVPPTGASFQLSISADNSTLTLHKPEWTGD